MLARINLSKPDQIILQTDKEMEFVFKEINNPLHRLLPFSTNTKITAAQICEKRLSVDNEHNFFNLTYSFLVTDLAHKKELLEKAANKSAPMSDHLSAQAACELAKIHASQEQHYDAIAWYIKAMQLGSSAIKKKLMDKDLFDFEPPERHTRFNYNLSLYLSAYIFTLLTQQKFPPLEQSNLMYSMSTAGKYFSLANSENAELTFENAHIKNLAHAAMHYDPVVFFNLLLACYKNKLTSEKNHHLAMDFFIHLIGKSRNNKNIQIKITCDYLLDVAHYHSFKTRFEENHLQEATEHFNQISKNFLDYQIDLKNQPSSIREPFYFSIFTRLINGNRGDKAHTYLNKIENADTYIELFHFIKTIDTEKENSVISELKRIIFNKIILHENQFTPDFIDLVKSADKDINDLNYQLNCVIQFATKLLETAKGDTSFNNTLKEIQKQMQGIRLIKKEYIFIHNQLATLIKKLHPEQLSEKNLKAAREHLETLQLLINNLEEETYLPSAPPLQIYDVNNSMFSFSPWENYNFNTVLQPEAADPSLSISSLLSFHDLIELPLDPQGKAIHYKGDVLLPKNKASSFSHNWATLYDKRENQTSPRIPATEMPATEALQFKK